MIAHHKGLDTCSSEIELALEARRRNTLRSSGGIDRYVTQLYHSGGQIQAATVSSLITGVVGDRQGLPENGWSLVVSLPPLCLCAGFQLALGWWVEQDGEARLEAATDMAREADSDSMAE